MFVTSAPITSEPKILQVLDKCIIWMHNKQKRSVNLRWTFTFVGTIEARNQIG